MSIAISTPSSPTIEEEDDDFIVFLEERNVDNSSFSNLPHLRANCLFHKFSAPHFESFCANCFCYCCDLRASDCKKWSSHCEATDQGPLKSAWKIFKSNEIDAIRIEEGRPAKKTKTMLSFFQKSDNIAPEKELLTVPVTEKTVSSINPVVVVEGGECSTVSSCSSSGLKITEEILTRSSEEINHIPLEISASQLFSKTPSKMRRVTKKVAEFPWADIMGVLSFNTGNVLLPPPLNLKINGRYGRNKFISCLICGQYEKDSPWATAQYRASESRYFLAHEQSEIHCQAVAKSINQDKIITDEKQG